MEGIIHKEILEGMRTWHAGTPASPLGTTDLAVLRGLSGEECGTIAAYAEARVLGRKETIYAQGEVDNTLYLLFGGAVKLMKITAQGNSLITDILGRGALFGWINDVHPPERNEWAIAMEDGLILCVSRDGLSRMEEAAPGLATKMKGLMEDRRRRREDRLVDMMFRTVEQRLAKALLSLAHDFGSRCQGRDRLNLSLTHQTFADLVASTRETITAIFSRLRKNGIIDYEDRSIVIRSVDRLHEVARASCGAGTEE
jgi:CRP-like cAMP-binding protein